MLEYQISLILQCPLNPDEKLFKISGDYNIDVPFKNATFIFRTYTFYSTYRDFNNVNGYVLVQRHTRALLG